MFAKKRVASVLTASLIAVGAVAAMGSTASATTQCPLNSHALCLFTGDSYTGLEWNFAPRACYTIGYIKYLPSAFKDEVNSATNSDDSPNTWSLYNDRSGIYSDTLLVRLPYGSSISHLSSSNVADYIKATT